MTIREKVEKLRELLHKNHLSAYIVSNSDPHQSEYVPDYWKCREWITGFTGSAGTAVITSDKAGLWTDGRYYIQAAMELENTGISLFKSGEPGVPEYQDWLADELPVGSTAGINGKTVSVKSLKKMEKLFGQKKITLNTGLDLVSEIWNDRPSLPDGAVFIHSLKYAGQSRTEKLEELRRRLNKKNATLCLITSLEETAWLFNIRGSDILHTPVVTAFSVVSSNQALLFINKTKLPPDVTLELERDGISIKDYHTIYSYIRNLSEQEKITYDPETANAFLVSSIPDKTLKIEEPGVVTAMKAVKNSTEIDNFRNSLVKDGAAMVKFLCWLDQTLGKEEIDEISAAEKLEGFRKEQEGFSDTSFDTIAAYRDHGAMMHYKAEPEMKYRLEQSGFFLVDSGGQYFGGTTDITRTIVLGPLSIEEKTDFTLVLKSMIALASARFLKGTDGKALDILARKPMWDRGMDYKSGTGHGVGYFLSVHEGPQRLKYTADGPALEKGMIITNEPGIYKEGLYGIRTENMMLVTEDRTTEAGEFYRFETITLCPIDLEGILPELLDENEKEWLNRYHERVYRQLSPYIDKEESEWLMKETREI